MAETTAVLDKLVFDFGYDVVDTLPVVWKVSVAREYQKIQAGQTVAITVHVVDNMTTYGRRYPFNPAQAPVMTLYDPLDRQVGSPVSMAQIATGTYTYIWQTVAEGVEHYVPGLYSAHFAAHNGDQVMLTRKHGVFTIVQPLTG